MANRVERATTAGLRMANFIAFETEYGDCWTNDSTGVAMRRGPVVPNLDSFHRRTAAFGSATMGEITDALLIDGFRAAKWLSSHRETKRGKPFQPTLVDEKAARPVALIYVFGASNSDRKWLCRSVWRMRPDIVIFPA